ncbi:MAG TPA: class I SAM-dependent methyltransferase [Solirubrobacterales bacterium]|nr:class I SAM-dependent methyltransferase [Solirubrobacterales bacterium]
MDDLIFSSERRISVTRPYEKLSEVYDVINQSRKNYLEQATKVSQLARCKTNRSVAREMSLLDVACGTGLHLEHFASWFAHVEGLDLNEEMLAVARTRLPDVLLHHGDMMDFELGRKFDVITCLSSAIGNMKRYVNLREAIMTMARHLKPGGILMIEPWMEPDSRRPGTVHGYLVDVPGTKIAHVGISTLRDGVLVYEMHFLVGRPTGITSFVEVHELGLFTRGQFRTAFESADLIVDFDEEGLSGRGLYAGIKPT